MKGTNMKKLSILACLACVFGLSACSTFGQKADYTAHFAFDKATLCSKDAKATTEYAKQLKAEKPAKVEVVGHTDSVGTKAYNKKLGLRRANSVKAVLVKNGVCAKRIVVKSEGENRPVADNATAEGRRLNRRVEVIVEE